MASPPIEAPRPSPTTLTATRLGDGPIIQPGMDDRMGNNINGPSLIRVPEWVTNPLGRYYLYFAHHDGSYIRLAYADHITGPWRIHGPGVLPLARSHFRGHLASPDVLVDHRHRQIRLYYHGCDAPTGIDAPQVTRLALSPDGLHFNAHPEVLGPFYMRVAALGDWHYALTMPGHFWRSKDGLGDFQPGPRLFTAAFRHGALLFRDGALFVFFSRAGDCPERILTSRIDPKAPWPEWTASEPVTVLAPERDYEGGDLPLAPSTRGMARGPVRELRDPAIFEEAGKTYLLYSVAGERGIALAELTFNAQP